MGEWGKRGRTKPGKGGKLRPHLRARLAILQDEGAPDEVLALKANVSKATIYGAKRLMRYQGHIRKQTKLCFVRRKPRDLNLF